MNNINQLINIQENNNIIIQDVNNQQPRLIRRAFNRIVGMIPVMPKISENFKLSFIFASLICTLLRSITPIIINNSDYKTESLNDLQLCINNIGGVIDIIAYILAWQQNKPTNLPTAPAYNELPNLPAGCNYSSSDICSISWEKLTIGDTVCCERQLYSYKSLVECYREGFKVPHSPNTNIDFTKNVYKMPQYGITEENSD